MKFEQIPLDQIATSPLNTRQNFEGVDFDGLVASIAEKGVLQPIILRPVNGGYEIVAGERRYRAMQKVALISGTPADQVTIPATVHQFTDDEAFEVMTIENLQRSDLSDYEEAQSFKAYVDRKGENTNVIEELAGRVGVRPGYIRGRVAIMQLPKYIRETWRKGKLKAGHLFQLLRIDAPSDRKGLYKEILYTGLSIKETKRRIDNRSFKLIRAIFDKAECVACPHNSSRQHKLFAVDVKDDVCMKPSCFIEKLRAELTETWDQTDFAAKNKLGGFVFKGEIDYGDYTNLWHPLPVKECRGCDRHVALINPRDGGNYEHNADVCIDKKCAAAMERRERAKARGQKTDNEDPDAPRKPWHGEYFREKFYKERLPEVFKDIDPDSHTAARLTLYTILRKFSQLHPWFAQKRALLDDKAIEDIGDSTHEFFRITEVALIEELSLIDKADLQQLTIESLGEIAASPEFDATDRLLIGDHINVDLSKEWRPDEEYLKKKIKAELIQIGHEFGVFKQYHAEVMLHDIFGKSSKGFEALKKSELIKLFTDPQIKLDGVVPNEILNGTTWEPVQPKAPKNKRKTADKKKDTK